MIRRILPSCRPDLLHSACAVAVMLLAGAVVAQDPPADGPESDADRVESSFTTGFRDAIDASAPQDAKAANRLQLAESLIHKGQFERALEALLYTLDKADGAMVRLADGGLASVADEANRLIGSLPAETMDLYRRQYGPASDKALKEAIDSGRREPVETVAVQFRHTPAGIAAVRRLAAMHFDRGEFGLALRRYEQILDENVDAGCRLRAAYAAAASGQTKRAQEIAATLDDADLRGVERGVESRARLSQMLAEAAKSSPPPIVADWTMPFGDPTSSALAQPGEPILLQRWHQPLAFRVPLQSQIERLTQDLRDMGTATVPAMLPLAIGDRVIARTMHGTSVYSIADGRLLWETDAGQSLEQALSLNPNAAFAPAMRQVLRLRGQFGIDPMQSSPEYGVLANALFRDGVYGHVSADARRLYVIEDDTADDGSPFVMGNNGMNVMWGNGAGGSVNRLVAYDLETGRLAWPRFGGLGGGLSSTPFEPPLAGYFFFGPPTPLSNSLFVIGEKDKQIRLVELDPESGQERWTRPIAEAQVGIAQDPVRQMWPAQVAVANGILVCPTTVGWLVAVEQASHSILWAARYTPPNPARDASGENPGVSPASLNSRWGAAAPLIRGNRVYFTPAEESRLVCFDLTTGKLLWQHGKAGGLYLAGADADVAIVVGALTVDGLDLESGAIRWSVTLRENASPSGRAAITAGRLYVPLRGETLLTLDTQRGKIIAETPLPADTASLGNLLLHRGTLVSLATDGLTAFEERSRLVAEIAQRLERNSVDAGALLQQAQLQYADGNVDAAAQTLDDLSEGTVPADQADRLRDLRWDVLTALVASNGKSADERLETLRSMSRTPDERFFVSRLEADRHRSAGNPEDAVQAYLSLLEVDGDRTISEDDGRRLMSLDAWVSGRLQDAWTMSDGAVRQRIEQRLESAFSSRSPQEQARLAELLRFLPASATWLHELAAQELADGKIAAAELRLLRLSHRSDPDESAAAYRALAEAARNRGLVEDADFWRRLADAGKTGPGQGRDQAESMFPAHAVRPTDVWGDYRFTVLRSSGYATSEPAANLRLVSAKLPFYRDRSIQLLPDRLAFSGPGGVGLDHVIPLQVSSHAGSHTIATASGHVVLMLYRGILQAVSPLENRILWSVPVPDEFISRTPSEQPVSPMRSAGSLVSASGCMTQSRQFGSLASANAAYVAIERRHEVSVLDALTGEWRWSRSDVPRGTTIVDTDSLLYVIPADGRPGKAYRATDGEEVDASQGIKALRHAVSNVGDRLLLAVQEPSLTLPLGLRVGGGAAISLLDPLSGSSIWKRTFPSETLFQLAADGRLIVLTPDGLLQGMNPATGALSKLGELPLESLRRNSSVVLLEDQQGIYAVVNVGRADATFAGIATMATNGEIFAFNNADGSLRWRKEISHRRLICEDFGQTPVLLFVDSDRTETANQSVWKVSLLALDKGSGNAVLDESHFMNSTPVFRAFSVRPDRRSIELTGFNSQLRLLAVDREPTAAPARSSPASE